MIELKYSYLAANILFFLIFLIIFLLRKDLRRQMLVMGLLGSVAGPLSEIWYFKDYWQPDIALLFLGIAIEDVIFGFSAAGIGAVLYEFVFREGDYKKLKNVSEWEIATMLLLGALILIVLTNILGVNSIYSSMVLFTVLALIVMAQRRDLFPNTLFSAVLMAFVGFITYQTVFNVINPNIVTSWWFLGNLSGILVLGVPIEEILWFFTWGLLAGPIYEFAYGLKQKKLVGKS